MPTLFRQQVLPAQEQPGQPVPWLVPQLDCWAWLLLLSLAASLLWAAQLSYAEKVSVEGVVQPVAAPVLVRSPVRGIVRKLHVAEGARVDARQALLVLDDRQLGAAGASDVDMRLAQNRDQQRSLRRRQARLRELHQQTQQLTASQQRSAAQQTQILGDQLQLARQRVAAMQTEHRRARRLLAQRWLSPADVQHSEVALLAARQNLLGTLQQYQSVQSRQRELAAQRRIQQSRNAEQLAEVQAQLIQLAHAEARLQVSEQTLLPAPISGRIADLAVQVGRHVESGDALLTIAPPAGTKHPVDVLLPSTAAARVRTGMPVRLRYAGYPHQEHGSASGTVSFISQVRQAGSGPPLFRARINIDELPESIDRVPAGMLVNADIVLRSQSLWRWLWQPAAEAFARL